MHPIKRVFTIILSTYILISCEFYSDIERAPVYQPTLTIHAFMSQHDIQAVVSYTHPRDTLEAQDVPDIPELEVWLTENGQDAHQLSAKGEGYYRLDSEVFQTGQDYAIRVKDETGRLILESGSDQLPAAPKILSARYVQDTTTVPESNVLRLDLANPINKYHGFDVSTFYSIDGGETFQNSRDSIYGIFRFRSLLKPTESSPDILSTSIKTATFLRPDPGESGIYIDAVSVKVSHFSPGMMLFFEELKEAEQSFNEPFATRSPVYSNITGGYGVFGAYYFTDTLVYLEK